MLTFLAPCARSQAWILAPRGSELPKMTLGRDLVGSSGTPLKAALAAAWQTPLGLGCLERVAAWPYSFGACLLMEYLVKN